MNDLSFRETLHQGWAQTFQIRTVLFESRTDHQHLVIFDNPAFGRVMALDGIIQTTERDEFIYHEMLAHVRSEEHTSELQSRGHLVCRPLLEIKTTTLITTQKI